MIFSLNEKSEESCIWIDIKDKVKKEKKEKKEKNVASIHVFLDKWKEQYENKKYFSFVINTDSLTSPSVKDCYTAIKFIRKLKKEKTQYLTHSVVIINNYHVRNLLFYIFKIQKPVAPVFIVKDLKLGEELNNTIKTTSVRSALVKCFCDINEVYYISNKADPDNYIIDKTLDAIDTIDDSIIALKTLAE